MSGRSYYGGPDEKVSISACDDGFLVWNLVAATWLDQNGFPGQNLPARLPTSSIPAGGQKASFSPSSSGSSSTSRSTDSSPNRSQPTSQTGSLEAASAESNLQESIQPLSLPLFLLPESVWLLLSLGWAAVHDGETIIQRSAMHCSATTTHSFHSWLSLSGLIKELWSSSNPEVTSETKDTHPSLSVAFLRLFDNLVSILRQHKSHLAVIAEKQSRSRYFRSTASRKSRVTKNKRCHSETSPSSHHLSVNAEPIDKRFKQADPSQHTALEESFSSRPWNCSEEEFSDQRSLSPEGPHGIDMGKDFRTIMSKHVQLDWDGLVESTGWILLQAEQENEYQRILRDLLRVAAAAVEPFLRKGECSVSHPEHRRAVLEELFRFVESQFDNPNLDLGPQDLRTLRLMAKALDLEAQQIGGRSRSSSNNAQSSLENLPLASILHLADRVLLGDEEFLKLQEQGGKASTLTELPLPPSKSNPRLAIALSHRTLYSPEPPILQRNWSPVEQSLQVLMRSIQSTQGTNIAAWSQQSVEHQLRRSAVFGDLWERGYFVTCGSKFGADFLVYQDHPSKVHSDWMCLVASPNQDMAALSMVTGSRLTTNVNKSLLLASVDLEAHPVDLPPTVHPGQGNQRIHYTSILWDQGSSVPPPEASFLLLPQEPFR